MQIVYQKKKKKKRKNEKKKIKIFRSDNSGSYIKNNSNIFYNNSMLYVFGNCRWKYEQNR